MKAGIAQIAVNTVVQIQNLKIEKRLVNSLVLTLP